MLVWLSTSPRAAPFGGAPAYRGPCWTATAKAPTFDQLVEREIEVRWLYWVKDSTAKSGRRSEYIWCVGTVVQVADGKTFKSKKAKPPLMPWGAVRIRWPEDAEFGEKESFVWSVLKPADFAKECHLGWRYSKAELARLKAERLAGKRQREE